MISHKRQYSGRNLLAEMSAIISAHDMHMRMLHAHGIHEECMKEETIKRTNTQNHCQQDKLPKYLNRQHQYRKSPLGQEEHQMPVTESSKNDSSEVKIRKYKKNNDVAYHCQKLLAVTAYPDVAQLTMVVNQISQTSTAEVDEIKSLVLQWFRKRREYLAMKVYNVCDDLMNDVWRTVLANRYLSYDSTVEAIMADTVLMEKMVNRAKLPVKDEENAIAFVRRKVKDYFMKLCIRTYLEEQFYELANAND